MPARDNAALCLPADYKSRRAYNVALKTTDFSQICVYRYAAEIAAADPAVRTVLDWGCGTGWKLLELFGHLDTLGADVDYRLPMLQARFPARRWAVCPVPIDADLVLCVDVIEHLDDPLDLLRQFAAGTWRHLVISTPERERVAKHKCESRHAARRQLAGPPANRWHVREWTASEFARLIRREIGISPEIQILRRWNLVAHCTRNQ